MQTIKHFSPAQIKNVLTSTQAVEEACTTVSNIEFECYLSACTVNNTPSLLLAVNDMFFVLTTAAIGTNEVSVHVDNVSVNNVHVSMRINEASPVCINSLTLVNVDSAITTTLNDVVAHFEQLRA